MLFKLIIFYLTLYIRGHNYSYLWVHYHTYTIHDFVLLISNVNFLMLLLLLSFIVEGLIGRLYV